MRGIHRDINGIGFRPVGHYWTPIDGSNAEPIHSPAPNVIKNVWQFMRDNGLSKRVFRGHDDIVDHWCHAWNCLTDLPWCIVAIRMCDWPHGF
jgi:hypothetical protein